MSIQEALKMMRIEIGITQEDLALYLGKAFGTINRWENGKSFPSRANALKIVNIAKQYNASDECIKYLKDTLMLNVKREHTGTKYGFPDIDTEFLFQLADNSENAIYVIEANSYNLLYVNRTAEKLACANLSKYGYSINDRPLNMQKDKRCYKFFGNHNTVCDFCPLHNISKDSFTNRYITEPNVGGTYKVRTKSAKLHGKDVFIVFLTDVTDLCNERKALYQMTNDSQTAIGIYSYYDDERIQLIFMNNILYELIGTARKEALMNFGATQQCLISPQDRKQLIDDIKICIEQKTELNGIYQMKTNDNNYHLVNIKARLVKTDKEKKTFYCVFNFKD